MTTQNSFVLYKPEEPQNEGSVILVELNESRTLCRVCQFTGAADGYLFRNVTNTNNISEASEGRIFVDSVSYSKDNLNVVQVRLKDKEPSLVNQYENLVPTNRVNIGNTLKEINRFSTDPVDRLILYLYTFFQQNPAGDELGNALAYFFPERPGEEDFAVDKLKVYLRVAASSNPFSEYTIAAAANYYRKNTE